MSRRQEACLDDDGYDGRVRRLLLCVCSVRQEDEDGQTYADVDVHAIVMVVLTGRRRRQVVPRHDGGLTSCQSTEDEIIVEKKTICTVSPASRVVSCWWLDSHQ